MLIPHHRLHAWLVELVTNVKKFRARQRDRFLEGNQLRAALDANFDHAQARVRRRTKAKYVGSLRTRERAGVAAARDIAELSQRALQPRRVAARNADQLETRIGLKERGMVQPALAQAGDED